MTGNGVRFDRDGALGIITLDRPDVSNAVDLPTAEAFGAAVTAASDDEFRAVLLQGTGKRFCAGGDVASMAAATNAAEYLLELATVLERHLRRLSELDKPVVAVVQGAVAGAGLAFVLNSDIVIAAESTKFVMAYSGVGLTPDCGVSYLLPRAIGQQRALELALTGRILTAPEARDWALVTEFADDDEAAKARGHELAKRLANGPTFALGHAKRLIRDSWRTSREHNARDEARTISQAVSTDDARECIAAFARQD
jgi:2-(1,2-epoxy-1,2-dihydrophenyl)acetyl-CoA isomerase